MKEKLIALHTMDSMLTLLPSIIMLCSETGMMPVLEIVFLLAKTEVQENKLIRFESKSGMPLQGEQKTQ